MRAKEVAALLALAALWGGSFLFIRIAVPAFGPVVLACLRVILAGVGLLAYAAALRRSVELRGRWRPFLLLGALNGAIPYSLIATAELHLTASLAVILNATTPLFTALVAAVWLRERLTARTVAGLVAGVGGVAILVGWSPLPLDRVLLLSVGASLAAALSYGLAGVQAKTAFAGTPPLTLAIGQQVGAALLLLPFALPLGVVNLSADLLSAGVIAALVGLALLCTSLGYLLYFYLIVQVGPTRTLSVTFLMPGFGVLWSVVFLREAVWASTFVGLGVILASVVLVTGVRLRMPGAGSARAAAIPPGSAES
jgi:drug/metabolite transporter (DMT)-like permease